MTDEGREFGARLRALMRARGMTPKSLAWAMGKDETARMQVVRWMRGDSLPGYASLRMMRAALRCDWEELMGE